MAIIFILIFFIAVDLVLLRGFDKSTPLKVITIFYLRNYADGVCKDFSIERERV